MNKYLTHAWTLFLDLSQVKGLKCNQKSILLISVLNYTLLFKKLGNFPGSAVVKTPCPLQGPWVLNTGWELRFCMLHDMAKNEIKIKTVPKKKKKTMMDKKVIKI